MDLTLCLEGYCPVMTTDMGHTWRGLLPRGRIAITRGSSARLLQASLVAVKVLDANGKGYLSDLINGLQWIYNNQSGRTSGWSI